MATEWLWTLILGGVVALALAAMFERAWRTHRRLERARRSGHWHPQGPTPRPPARTTVLAALVLILAAAVLAALFLTLVLWVDQDAGAGMARIHEFAGSPSWLCADSPPSRPG